MELTSLTSIDKESWEHIYNHKEICEALLSEGSHVAKALYHSKVYHIHNMHGPLCDETAFIMLTSLNRGLYDYLVIKLNLSFAQCCFDNRAHTHIITDLYSLVFAGDKIIDSYAKCLLESKENHLYIEKICNYINTHISEDLSLAKVSSVVYLSKNHICTMFKSLVGTTYCEYIKQQRIRHARVLLRTTNRSIDEIAALCGYNSPTYFATVFKTEIGMTPSAFRSSIK